MLFNLYTAFIFGTIADTPGLSIGGKNVNNLHDAGDTALIADSGAKFQQLLKAVNEEGEEYGMKINIRKTKSMLISRTANEEYRLSLNGKEIEPINQLFT